MSVGSSRESYWGSEDLTLDELTDLEDSEDNENEANANLKEFKDRLSVWPPPSASDLYSSSSRKRKRGKRHGGPSHAAQVRRGLERRIARKVNKAKDNVGKYISILKNLLFELNVTSVKLETYKFSEAIKESKSAAYAKKVTEEPPRHWSDSAPRSAMSSDGEFVVFHLPALFAEKSQVGLLTLSSILRFSPHTESPARCPHGTGKECEARSWDRCRRFGSKLCRFLCLSR